MNLRLVVEEAEEKRIEQKAMQGDIKAGRFYAALLFDRITESTDGKLFSPANWRELWKNQQSIVQTIINLLDQPANQDDLFSQFLLIALFTYQQNGKRCYEIIKRMAVKFDLAQFILAATIVLARNLNYSEASAKKGMDAFEKGKNEDHEDFYISYFLCAYPEILNELKQFNNAAGQEYVKQLLKNSEKNTPMENTFFGVIMGANVLQDNIQKIRTLVPLLGKTDLENEKKLATTSSLLVTLKGVDDNDKMKGSLPSAHHESVASQVPKLETLDLQNGVVFHHENDASITICKESGIRFCGF